MGSYYYKWQLSTFRYDILEEIEETVKNKGQQEGEWRSVYVENFPVVPVINGFALEAVEIMPGVGLAIICSEDYRPSIDEISTDALADILEWLEKETKN